MLFAFGVFLLFCSRVLFRLFFFKKAILDFKITCFIQSNAPHASVCVYICACVYVYCTALQREQLHTESKIIKLFQVYGFQTEHISARWCLFLSDGPLEERGNREITVWGTVSLQWGDSSVVLKQPPWEWQGGFRCSEKSSDHQFCVFLAYYQTCN